MRYPLRSADLGARCTQCPPDDQEEVRCHVAEALESACLAIRRSRRREEFSALLDLLLACKVAEEAVER